MLTKYQVKGFTLVDLAATMTVVALFVGFILKAQWISTFTPESQLVGVANYNSPLSSKNIILNSDGLSQDVKNAAKDNIVICSRGMPEGVIISLDKKFDDSNLATGRIFAIPDESDQIDTVRAVKNTDLNKQYVGCIEI